MSKDLKKEAKELAEEAFEVLDVSKKKKNVVDRLFGDMKKSSPLSQIAVGGGSGWVTGYVVIKVGKAAALTLLVTGVAVKVAHDRGYITINKRKVNAAMEEIQEQAKKIAEGKRKTYTEMVTNVYHSYKYLSIGFTGGFLAAVLF